MSSINKIRPRSMEAMKMPHQGILLGRIAYYI